MAKAFHLFPSLPYELRLQIWSHILHEPRNTTFRPKMRCEQKNFFAKLLCLNPCTLPPAATQVCSESRSEALKVYTRAFAYGTAPRYTYINFLLDRLIISDSDLFLNVPLDAYERGSIRKLALTYVNAGDFHFRFFASDSIRTTKALEVFKVVGPDWTGFPTRYTENRLKKLFEMELGAEAG